MSSSPTGRDVDIPRVVRSGNLAEVSSELIPQEFAGAEWRDRTRRNRQRRERAPDRHRFADVLDREAHRVEPKDVLRHPEIEDKAFRAEARCGVLGVLDRAADSQPFDYLRDAEGRFDRRPLLGSVAECRRAITRKDVGGEPVVDHAHSEPDAAGTEPSHRRHRSSGGVG